MPKVIFKCKYIKSGKAKSHLNNLVNYMATREGAQKLLIEDKSAVSENQKQVIAEILNEFPDTKNMHEYKDYLKNPSMKNASEYITTALEFNLDEMAKKENYIGYIANRPRVEKVSTHGLFTAGEDEVDLEKVTNEVANHSGNIWTPIISLSREDAVLTGMDNAESWKLFAEQQAMTIAENLKIPFHNFKWYASYHDESYHPHIHMVCYSADPSKGYLTQNGIDNIRSSLTREIFSKELNLIYAEKTIRRDELKEKSKDAFIKLKDKISNGEINNPQLEFLMSELKEKLDNTGGKKVYGFLRPNVKEVVDKIVDELEKIPEIKNCYDLWWEMQQEIYSNYQDKIIKPLPLSKQTEFKSIKNMIISELVKEDSILSFENKSIEIFDVQETVGNKLTLDFQEIQNLSQKNNDDKLLYRIGTMYERGVGTEIDLIKAKEYYLKSAKLNNEFAQYQLGKLFLFGNGVDVDKEEAMNWFNLSAEQGNENAKYFLENMDKWESQSTAFAVMNVLNSLSRVFDNENKDFERQTHPKLDSQAIREMRKRKQALGQKLDLKEMKL